jgi:group I intron endonuclease
MKAKEPYGVVYRIKNKANGKCYHGQTVHLRKRWCHHLRCCTCPALRSAMKKYGVENFLFEVVEKAYSKKQLDDLEKRYVKTSLTPIGYNLVEGGAQGRPSKETLRKRSRALKAAWASYSEAEREARINATVSASSTPESKQRLSKSLKAAFAKPEVKVRLIKAQKASFTLDRRRAIGKRTREQWDQPGERKRRGAAIKQAHAKMSRKARERRKLAIQAAQTSNRKKISRQVKSRLTNPEFKARWIAGLKKSWTPERKAKISAIMKKVWARPGEKTRRRSSSAANKAAWAKPGERERRKQAMAEARKKRS